MAFGAWMSSAQLRLRLSSATCIRSDSAVSDRACICARPVRGHPRICVSPETQTPVRSIFRSALFSHSNCAVQPSHAPRKSAADIFPRGI